MQWSFIKTWAKEQGYSVKRQKELDNKSNPYLYTYQKDGSLDVKGTINSLSKLATIIFNHISDHKYVEHQQKYIKDQDNKDINHNELSGNW
jgi:hypothetical protein